MFSGFDVDHWDDHIIWMWRYSNLRFIGFYLAHGADATRSTWTRHWHDLKDLGWGIVPIWLPFASDNISAMARADGNDHGRRAISRAREAKLEHGAAIYLDVEAPVFTREPDDMGFTTYMSNWFRTVRAGGYTPGVYCSRLDAFRLLGPSFRTLRPVLFPFSIAPNTRATWDDANFQLTPALSNVWDPWSQHREWTSSADTVGCQYDWFNANRDRKIFHWPSATGRPDTWRDVDWDMSSVWDPSHPRAAAVVAMAGDRDHPDRLQVFTVRTNLIEHSERTATGQFLAGQELAISPADIGPTPSPELNGFDSTSAAAISRQASHMDLFVLGQDGYVRTMWMNNQETFSHHPWALNPGNLARRGSPIAAVSRLVDQFDIFYVSADHHLTTQWWNLASTDWSQNQRILPEPLVAGGSNIVVLGRAGTGADSSSLDVFYVSLNHVTEYSDPAWNEQWRVVHAAWVATGDWSLTPIPGLEHAAAGSGVAVVRDAAGTLHVVVQTRDRTTLRHATLVAGRAWQVAVGPGPLTLDVERRNWWMSLYLISLPDYLLLIGMTSGGTLAWSVYAGGRWTAVSDGATAFASSRPLAVALRGTTVLDVAGVDEEGTFLTRSLTISPAGVITLVSVP